MRALRNSQSESLLVLADRVCMRSKYLETKEHSIGQDRPVGHVGRISREKKRSLLKCENSVKRSVQTFWKTEQKKRDLAGGAQWKKRAKRQIGKWVNSGPPERGVENAHS